MLIDDSGRFLVYYIFGLVSPEREVLRAVGKRWRVSIDAGLRTVDARSQLLPPLLPSDQIARDRNLRSCD
jgi:hypothetical protein